MNKKAKELSPAFTYNLCKTIDDISPGNGTTLLSVERVLKAYGICEEKFFPMIQIHDSESCANKSISPEAFRNAYQRRSFIYQRLSTLEDAKNAMYYLRKPIALSFDMVEGIYDCPSGFMPPPDKEDKIIGGHAVAVLGYSDKKGVLIFQNSWGQKWGNGGCGYLPYEYFSEGYIRETWMRIERNCSYQLMKNFGSEYYVTKTGEQIRIEICVSANMPGKPFIWFIDCYCNRNQIIGWIHFVLTDYKVIEIEDLFILPNYRRLGIATILILILKMFALKNRFKKFVIWIDAQDVIRSDRANILFNFLKSQKFDIMEDKSKFRYCRYRAEKNI